MVEISVVIITYNKHDLLILCLDSVLKQCYKDYEIIVVDDGSIDGTRKLIKNLQKTHNNVRYFYHNNKGRGYSRNIGLEKSKGKIIAFTDDDCIVEKNWLKKIKESFDKNQEISAIGGAVLNPNNSAFAWATHILNFSSWCTINKKIFVNDCPTANVAYKKNDIKEVFFPVDYGNLDYEDTFFNFNLIRRGKKILFDPSIKVYHDSGIKNYENFLKNQQRKALSFLMRGYKIHGLAGKILIKFKFFNLFCPRLLIVFLRCLKSSKHFYKFIIYFPLIFRGELERGLTLIKRNGLIAYE